MKIKLNEKEATILLDSLIQSMVNTELSIYDNNDIESVYNKILEETKIREYEYF